MDVFQYAKERGFIKGKSKRTIERFFREIKPYLIYQGKFKRKEEKIDDKRKYHKHYYLDKKIFNKFEQ